MSGIYEKTRHDVERAIADVSKRLMDLPVEAGTGSAICDAGESIGGARRALDDGDLDRAHELIVLAGEQLDAAEGSPS